MEKRLQKFIADSDYCSRRKAEELIEQKRVKVNNKIAVIGMRVNEKDVVSIDGKKIKLKEKLIYIALNKPKNYVCTNRKISGEKNVFDLIDIKDKLFIVGRLDKNSRGLVLLTNDGDFGYRLTHPSFQHEKEYLVETSRELIQEAEQEMKDGVDINEKTKAKVKEIKRVSRNKYLVILTEGKRRQIRRMFEVFDCTVIDLKRTRIDKYELGRLREGQWSFIEK